MTEKDFYVNMMNLDVCDELVKDIESIMDEEDMMVTEENTPVKLRKKYRKEINELFTKKSKGCEDLFSLSYIIIHEFNINPESFIMCLDQENRKKLRTYAINNYNTEYHLRKEKKIKLEKECEARDVKLEQYVDIREFVVQ
jgi:hypothetical protein